MNIFVGNLSFETTDADLKRLFEGFGSVTSAVIVMRKEKKVPKSRGFGFVEMSDPQQALSAMSALNEKEFMGRVINVVPARPKTEPRPESKPKKQRPTRFEPETKPYPRQEEEEKKIWAKPVSRKPGTYKGGRRTNSYIRRHGLTEVPEAKPRRSYKDNPMRWRKRSEQAKPWQKTSGEEKPWERPAGETKPWKKASRGPKPWRKPEGGFKPWKKPEGETKPWKKQEGKPRPWEKASGESKPWKKVSGESKPWKKSAGESKPWKKQEGRPTAPWKKTTGESRPWKAKNEHPQRSGFNPSASLGMPFGKLRTVREGAVSNVERVRGSGERSRTKGRGKTGGYKR